MFEPSHYFPLKGYLHSCWMFQVNVEHDTNIVAGKVSNMLTWHFTFTNMIYNLMMVHSHVISLFGHHLQNVISLCDVYAMDKQSKLIEYLIQITSALYHVIIIT